jgi:hypothetical protein
MHKSQLKCPRCQQPTVVQVEPLFDISADPAAKQRLLGGVSNFVNCTSCGYSGGLSTPIVYHDNEKELLLTYFPPELGLPLNEQERIIGPLIKQAVDKLPPEKRKAYLFRPQSFLTYQSMIERILKEDGITPEMIKAQQGKANLIEKLLSATSEDARKSIIKKEESLVDGEFFALFSRLMESAIASGQEKITQQMDSIQQLLLTETSYGKDLQTQSKEIEEAIKTLQAVGKKLTREKLLDILLEAPNDTRLGALVSYTRPGLDYQFFQLLSERIEKKPGSEKEKLENLRAKLLEITREIDQRMEAEQKHAVDLLQILLSAKDLEQTLTEHLAEINDTFIQVLNTTMQQATQNQEPALLEKLKRVVDLLQQLSAPPPEYGLLQILMEAPDEIALNKLLTEHDAEITPEFTQFLSGIIAGSENQTDSPSNKDQDIKVIEQIQKIYRNVLKYSMMKNL